MIREAVMKSSPSYVVLVMRGDDWEALGPVATSFATKASAEGAAHDLSARFPKRTFGVYRLQCLFGTEQKIVRRSVKAESARAAMPEKRALLEKNLYKLRAAE